MLLIAGSFRIGIGVTEEVLAACRKVMLATHAEEGCLDYVFSADPLDEKILHVFERWESIECLEEHSKAPHIGPFREAMAGWDVTETNIYRYTVSSSESM
jgi:quinol monooxygenase YgiN